MKMKCKHCDEETEFDNWDLRRRYCSDECRNNAYKKKGHIEVLRLRAIKDKKKCQK